MAKPAKTHASPRKRAAARRNLEKAWEANRAHWEKTPARMAHARRSIQQAHAANRRRPRKLSQAQLDAARLNVAKARAALEARGRTPEHLAQLRQTVAQARAARTPESIRRQAAKIIKHGLFARRLPNALPVLGYDMEEFELRRKLLDRFLGATTELERKISSVLAEALWRRHRLHYAQAEWEWARVRMLLERAPADIVPTPDTARLRAYHLMGALLSRDTYHRRDELLTGSIERLLRRFLNVRTGGKAKFPSSLHSRPPSFEKQVSQFLHGS
jgi:hypothetical protein